MPWLELLSPAQVAVALSLIAFVLALAALIRQRRVARASSAAEVAKLGERLAQQEQALEQIKSNLEALVRHVTALEEKQLSHLQRFALVRFRAFPEVGSDLSFSLALLDAHGNGIILTSLFGRSETRVYAKPVQGGKSPYRLAPEEEQALAEAMRPSNRSQPRSPA